MSVKPYSYPYLYNHLCQLFPDAHCQLNHENNFQLLIAVVLSAQTTDVSVNKITPGLFEDYPDAYSLANAKQKDVEDHIHSIGLYHAKASNIIALSKDMVSRFEGKVPDNMEDLTSLAGVGRKTANVILSECFGVPSLAVDTHVKRVSYRLGLTEETDDVLQTEEKVCQYFPKKYWSHLHHLLIFFGRYQCMSRNPKCVDCPFKKRCNYLSKE